MRIRAALRIITDVHSSSTSHSLWNIRKAPWCGQRSNSWLCRRKRTTCRLVPATVPLSPLWQNDLTDRQRTTWRDPLLLEPRAKLSCLPCEQNGPYSRQRSGRSTGKASPSGSGRGQNGRQSASTFPTCVQREFSPKRLRTWRR